MSQSMDKSLQLLYLVAEGHDRLSALSRATGMPRSTIHRLVGVLVDHGFLRLQGNQYLLGHKLLELGELTKQQLHIPSVAKPHMEAVSAATSETVHLGQLVDRDIVYLEKVPGNRGLQMASRVGLRSPAQTTAMGKVLIAFGPEERWPGLAEGIARKTPKTITDPGAYLQELERVRRDGVAFDREENEVGIRCLAAPVWDATGRVAVAVSISCAAIYLDDERLAELIPMLKECARAISSDIGGASFAGRGDPPR